MEFRDLPVYRHKDEILDALRENQVIVVESPTGSGKTTQIPLILLEAGYAVDGIIGITQPRRIAAMSVCDFINSQLESENNFCSYKMRFYDTTDATTRIKIMTDGILLQELKTDPLLSCYSVIMVDEAHERSLNIDFILGLLKNLLPKRPDLKIIISSATINTKRFSRFMNNAQIISIKSRVYPVQVKYLPLAKEGDTDEVIDTIVNIVNFKMKIFAKSEFRRSDDILVFLPGEFEIKTCAREIAFRCDYKHLQIYPLYGRLTKEDQEAVFTPTEEGKIKIVIATNIAETSITIDGIKTVIDSGLAKINYYNQKNFSNALIPGRISKSSCEQRKGRAGRIAPGFCYRLYSEESFGKRDAFTLEEILRTDLSEVVLRMSDLGIYDYEHFPFITRPDKAAIASAEKTLRFLGAIDEQRHLTRIGELMVQFPLVPRHSRVIVESMLNYPDVMEEILIAVSFVSVRTPFVLPLGQEDEARAAHRRFANQDGDFASFLEIFAAFTQYDSQKKREEFCQRHFLDFQTMNEIVHVDEQLGDIVSALGFVLSKGGSREDYLCCLARGFLQYVCIKCDNNSYRSLDIDRIYIHPGSAYFKENPKFILAGEVVSTSRMYARTVSPLTPDVLNRISPSLLKQLEDKAVSHKKGNDEREKKEQKNGKQVNKAIELYGMRFNALQTVSKKGNSDTMAVIPVSDLKALSKAFGKARRHPKNCKAVLLVGDKFVHRGDQLFNIIDLYGKLPENNVPVDAKKIKSFTLETFDEGVKSLELLIRYGILPKDRTCLGFVELIQSKDTFIFNVNRDLYDALSNTGYSLMQLKDKIKGNKALERVYARVMDLLNRF